MFKLLSSIELVEFRHHGHDYPKVTTFQMLVGTRMSMKSFPLSLSVRCLASLCKLTSRQTTSEGCTLVAMPCLMPVVFAASSETSVSPGPVDEMVHYAPEPVNLSHRWSVLVVSLSTSNFLLRSSLSATDSGDSSAIVVTVSLPRPETMSGRNISGRPSSRHASTAYMPNASITDFRATWIS